MKFILHKSKKNGQFYFTLHARNGKVIANSETYKKKDSCMKGIMSVAKSAPRAALNIIDETRKKKAK